MRLSIFTTLALLLLSCSTGDLSSTNTSMIIDEDEAILRNIKTKLWPKAYGEQDTTLLGQLLHTDFQLIDDNGDTYTKADEMEYVGKYGPSYNEFSFEISSLKTFSNGVAVISGQGTMKGVEAGEAYITTYQSSNVLIKVDNEWKAINSHVSGVKEERFPVVENE